MGNPNHIDLAGNTLIVDKINIGATKAGETGSTIDTSDLVDGTSIGVLHFNTATNSSPSNGDVWFDGTDLNLHTGDATKKLEYQA